MKEYAKYAIMCAYGKMDPRKRENCFEVKLFFSFIHFEDFWTRFYD